MATRALDVVTILHALDTLDKELQTTGWNPKNPAQLEVFERLGALREPLARITGLDAKASRFYEELNAFLAQRGFSPLIDPFDPKKGLGVVSILDKLVRWLHGPGTRSDISTRKGAMPGFELPPNGVNVYEVAGSSGSYLLELLTQSDDTLWLFMHDKTDLEGLDMVKLAMDVMRKPHRTPMSPDPFGIGRGESPAFAGAKVPLIEFDVKPDLSWLLGADTTTVSGAHYFVAQAAQQFKMRMDETGARVKVATAAFAVRQAMILGPAVFLVDRPFYGWWTQRGIDLPMAVFFADWDCWRKTSGSLESL
ncbi:MAG TPA: hypothetical protein VGF67_21225 [Ktedonobacteraceae bacterium]